MFAGNHSSHRIYQYILYQISKHFVVLTEISRTQIINAINIVCFKEGDFNSLSIFRNLILNDK